MAISEMAKMIRKFRLSPIFFIEKMWGLVPQPIKEEFKIIAQTAPLDDFKAEWFEEFEKGKHISWQQWIILLAIEKGLRGEAPKRISIKSGHGIGKVQNNSLIIDTPNGKKMWKDIKVDSLLWGRDGKPTKVVKKFPHKDWGFYKITFDDGSFTYCGKEHLWNVRGRQERRKGIDGWRTLSLSEIMDIGVKRSNGVKSCRQWEIPNVNPIEYKEIKVDINPYLFGAFLGDGSKGCNKFNSGIEDWNHWVNEWQKEYSLSSIYQGDHFGILDFYSHYKKYCNKNTNRLFIHNDYKYNSIENRIALLQGLLDTDGNVGGNSRAEFCSISEKLVDDVVWLARSLGLKARKGKIKKPFYYTRDNNKKIKIFGQTAYRCSIVYNGQFDLFRIKRKQKQLSKNEARYSSRWIDKIEYSHKEDGHCVQVDSDDSLYLTNDFIPTHNTATLSWIIVWFLFCFKDSQIPCTSPTADQLHDILWKELSKWIDKIKLESVRSFYDCQDKYVRIKESPKTWFARARTGQKENPEALAGIHADDVLLVVDEASGVHNKVYEVAEGSLTNDNVLVILISNPVRNEGYFYDTHHSDKDNWQTLSFNSEDSPIVDWEYVDRIIIKYGKDSEEYDIRVRGWFAGESKMDDKGWVNLLSEQDLHWTTDEVFKGNKKLGIDPSGEGQDTTEWGLRDDFKFKCIASEKISNEKTIAEKTLTLSQYYEVDSGKQIVIDNFGSGANVSKVIAISTKGHLDCYGVNVGDPADDPDLFLNMRAELFWRLRQWIKAGGMLVHSSQLKRELLNIKFKRNLKGKIQIMSKEMMKREGIPSPNKADAMSLTFYKDDEDVKQDEDIAQQIKDLEDEEIYKGFGV